MINETETTKRPAYSGAIELSKIRRDGGTQSRVNMYQDVIDEYAQAMRDGVQFPPVLVYSDGVSDDFPLADGFHRVAAAEAAGLEKINALVYTGTLRDAILHSVGVNAAHGLRRSNDDKRRAVEVLLRDAEWREWSDREIARTAGVDHKTVGKWRADLIQRGEIPHLSTIAPQASALEMFIEVEMSYPATPSDDANVEAARQIALEILTRWSRDDLKDVLHDGFTGGVPEGISYRLGEGEIVIDADVTVPVDRKQIGIALTTANGTGVYRFEAIPLKDWAAERDALIGNPKVVDGLWNLLTDYRYLDYQVRPLLEKYGLITTGSRLVLTPTGRAMIDAYIAAHPALGIQLDIQRTFKVQAAMGEMEKLLRSLHGKQAKSGAWIPIEAGWNDNGTLGWAEALTKRGYLVSEKRKRMDGYASEKGMRFFAMTDKGCELLGAKLLPTPEPLPDLPYHHDAGVFVPAEPAFSVKVGDAVKERKGKKMGTVVELGAWPLVYIREPGVSWKSSVYDTRIEIIKTDPDAPANPLRLRELDDQTRRVWDHMQILLRQVEAWTSDEDDSPVGVNTRDLLRAHLTDMMIWTAETHTGVRLKLEAPKPIIFDEDTADPDQAAVAQSHEPEPVATPEAPTPPNVHQSSDVAKTTLAGLNRVELQALLSVEDGSITSGYASVSEDILDDLEYRMLVTEKNGEYSLTGLGAQVAARALAQNETIAEAPDELVYYDLDDQPFPED